MDALTWKALGLDEEPDQIPAQATVPPPPAGTGIDPNLLAEIKSKSGMMGPPDPRTSAALAAFRASNTRLPATPLSPAPNPDPSGPQKVQAPAPVQAPAAQTASAAAALRPAIVPPAQPQATPAGEVDMPPPVIPRGIDPAIRSQAMREAAMAHAVHGMVDRQVVTPWGFRNGMRPTVLESPVADAAQAMALQPLQEEQARAAHEQSVADTLNKFQQARAALSSKVQLGKMLEEGRLGSAQIAAGGRQGVADTKAKSALDVANAAGGWKVKASQALLGRQMAMLEARDAASRNQKVIKESGMGPNDYPSLGDIRIRENSVSGLSAVNKLRELLKDPEATSLLNGTATFGQFRFAADDKATALQEARDQLHEALLQGAQRQGTKQGGSLWKSTLPLLGDDSNQAARALDDSEKLLQGEKVATEGRKPKWDWENSAPLGSSTPFADAAANGGKPVPIKPKPAAPPQAKQVRGYKPSKDGKWRIPVYTDGTEGPKERTP